MARVAAVCLAGLSLAAPARAQAPPPAAAAPQIFFVAGDVQLRHGSGAAVRAERGRPLEPGDLVITGAGARAQLLLADGARVALSPGTEARLPPRAGADAPHLRLGAGSLRVQLPQPQAVFRLWTPRASVQVRGLAFSVGFNGDGSFNVASEREPVEVCTAAGCVTAADDNLRVRADHLPPTRTNARASWR